MFPMDMLAKINNVNVLAVAFAIWAFVVWHIGRSIVHKIEEAGKQLEILNDRVRTVNYKLSNKITNIEAHLRHADPKFSPFKNGDT